MLHTLRAAALLLVLLGLGAPARAAVAGPTTTFLFGGQCSDCAGTVRGELVLRNYVLGQSITRGNFVSFHYDGSNLQDAFTITGSEAGDVGGALASEAAPGNFSARNAGNFFSAMADGSWFLGTPALVADFGTGGTFTVLAATAVPEPASLGLLLVGLAAAGAAARRRPTA